MSELRWNTVREREITLPDGNEELLAVVGATPKMLKLSSLRAWVRDGLNLLFAPVEHTHDYASVLHGHSQSDIVGLEARLLALESGSSGGACQCDDTRLSYVDNSHVWVKGYYRGVYYDESVEIAGFTTNGLLYLYHDVAGWHWSTEPSANTLRFAFPVGYMPPSTRIISSFTVHGRFMSFYGGSFFNASVSTVNQVATCPLVPVGAKGVYQLMGAQLVGGQNPNLLGVYIDDIGHVVPSVDYISPTRYDFYARAQFFAGRSFKVRFLTGTANLNIFCVGYEV